ncbi:MAG: flagellar export chaperone FliS, partial [Woeseiaceae bacterium]|nr:flagellar export chaperone FliS [Woeseiaceae bacterium]
MNLTTTSSGAAARQYQQLDTQSRIASATPHQIIQLMMEQAVARISIARRHMQNEETYEKGVNIGSAISIINGLQASLNHKADENMAANFDALYAYMMRRLLEANLHDDVQMLDEVTGLLKELKEAWDAIADKADSAVADAEQS